MDILGAFRADPKKSSKILSRIYSDDKKISKLAKQLIKLNKSENLITGSTGFIGQEVTKI